MNWYEISITFRWPHEGIMIGYEIITPDEEDDFTTVRLHLTFFTLSFDFG